MNWFTKRIILTSNPELKEKYFNSEEFGGCCKHCEEDHGLAYAVSYENDSFGRESYVMCEACSNKEDEQEDEELHTCHDCKKEVPYKHNRRWREWDFDPSDGGEPIHVCDECRKLPAHLERVRRDREDYEAYVENDF